jgi:quinol monooxygenase YgiN
MRRATIRTTVLLCAALAASAGCGDDEGGSTAGGAGDGEGGAGPATTTASTTSSTGSGGEAGDGGSGGQGDEAELLVMVQGDLAGDAEDVQPDHDALAAAGEEQAKAAGDIAHDVLFGGPLGSDIPGDGFLALDRWSSNQNLDAFYGDPGFQEAFGALFAAPPSFAVYERRPEWSSWGDLDAADGIEPHWFVVVEARLADRDVEEIRAEHDALVDATRADVEALGDVGHIVHLGRDDQRAFVAVDVWVEVDGIESVYTDPALAAALGPLFDGPPTITVHESSDWYQW